MEKKESSSYNPLGMCEKLFNVLNINPAFQSIRRLTFRQQEPTANSNSSPPLSPQPSNTIKNPSPPRNLPAPPKQEPVTPEKKPAEVVQPKPPAPPPAYHEKAKNVRVTVEPAPPEMAKVTPTDTTPSSVTAAKVAGGKGGDKASNGAVPVPTPPPQKALPTPQPPPGVAASGRQTKNINDRTEEYINRARSRMRTTSNAGAGNRTSSR